MANFDLRDITFSTVEPAQLPEERWHELATLDFAALKNELALGEHRSTVSDTEVATAVGAADINHYKAAKLDPNTAVGGRLGANQRYAGPLYTVASNQHGELVGALYGANNASGSPEAIERKMGAFLPLKKWAWGGFLAVHPEYQHRGIGTMLGAYHLEAYNPLQPASAYAWRVRYITGVLGNNGLHAAGQVTEDYPFGSNAGIGMQRFTVRSVAQALYHVWRIPGGRDALRQLHRQIGSLR